MKKNEHFYSKKIVQKPWGYEYVIYKDASRLAITFVKINPGHSTSLHCHPKKKTGFIILEGKAAVQIGLYRKNIKLYKSISRMVLRPGLFHSIKATSNKGVSALEVETPYKKKDLVRFKDNYGRENKGYESKKFTKNLSSNFMKFKKPKIGKKFKYNFPSVEVSIETRKNLKNYFKKNEKRSSAILDGNIVDSNGKNVISFGEIVKTNTLKILSDRFYIKKPITILTVKKNIFR